MEDNFQLADNLAFWETIKDASLANNYIKNIKLIKNSYLIEILKIIQNQNI